MNQGPSSMPGTATMTFTPGQQIQGTWANSGVDINLDNLTLGGIKKAPAPSMNQLQTIPGGPAPAVNPSSPPPAIPSVTNQPGMMMMGGQMMGGTPSGGVMMMGAQPMPSPVMNGSVMIPPGMMVHGARMPGVVGMPGYPTMPQMMGVMQHQQQQQSVGPMSMPSNMGL